MVRFIVEVAFPFAWTVWSIWATVRYIQTKRKIASLDDERLCLSRRERRARARKQLQQRDDQENQRLIEQTLQHLQEGKTFQ